MGKFGQLREQSNSCTELFPKSSFSNYRSFSGTVSYIEVSLLSVTEQKVMCICVTDGQKEV